MAASPFIPTIIIVEDPTAEMRGYSIKGREFRLRKLELVKTTALHLDGVELESEYYQVPMAEYLRVVPEAARDNWDDDYVLIPKELVRPSFRPTYIKSSVKPLF